MILYKTKVRMSIEIYEKTNIIWVFDIITKYIEMNILYQENIKERKYYAKNTCIQ